MGVVYGPLIYTVSQYFRHSANLSADTPTFAQRAEYFAFQLDEHSKLSLILRFSFYCVVFMCFFSKLWTFLQKVILLAVKKSKDSFRISWLSKRGGERVIFFNDQTTKD